MRIFFVLILLLGLTFFKGIAQSISISPDGSPPDSSAILDIQSTTKGLLLPRMTQEQRDSIINPSLGLTIFQTDIIPGMYYFDGATWSPVDASSSNGNWSLSGTDMYNTNSGKIGIGTDLPEGLLHVKGFDDVSQLILDENDSQTNMNPIIRLRRSDGYDLMWINSDYVTNTFVGFETGRVNNKAIGGIHNTFIGSESGFSNISGYGNTALGTGVLSGNTKGSNNTAGGLFALSSNTTAGQNVAFGASALENQSYFNNDVEWNTNNVAIGYAALKTNQPTTSANGIDNTAVGSFALTANTKGYDNTALGSASLYTNIDGHENTAVGRQSLFYNTIGDDNTSSGYKSLRNNVVGSQNTAQGAYALFNLNTSGCTGIGYESLYNNSTGGGNTGVGYYALHTTSTGFDNTAIGSYSGNSDSGSSSATALGSYSIASISQKVRLGSASVNIIEGQVAYSWPSDGRFKENLKEDVLGLEFILKLQPVSYNFNRLKFAQHIKEKLTPEREELLLDESQKRTIGFVAQDVEKIIAQTGFNSFDAVHAPQSDTDNYSMGYAEFVVPLVKAVQELNEKLITENELLLRRIEKLELQIDIINKK